MEPAREGGTEGGKEGGRGVAGYLDWEHAPGRQRLEWGACSPSPDHGFSTVHCSQARAHRCCWLPGHTTRLTRLPRCKSTSLSCRFIRMVPTFQIHSQNPGKAWLSAATVESDLAEPTCSSLFLVPQLLRKIQPQHTGSQIRCSPVTLPNGHHLPISSPSVRSLGLDAASFLGFRINTHFSTSLCLPASGLCTAANACATGILCFVLADPGLRVSPPKTSVSATACTLRPLPAPLVACSTVAYPLHDCAS